MNQKYRESQKRNRADAAVTEWARKLSDRELQTELATLQRKCKSPVYQKGLAGHLLRAVESETRRRAS